MTGSHTSRSKRELQADGLAELDTLARERAARMRSWDARWHAAGDWCAQTLPDLIDGRTASACGFAVASALRLRSELGRPPTPSEVRAYRRQWLAGLDAKATA